MNTGERGDTVTLAIKKHYLYLGLGVVIGFGAGYATAMALRRGVLVGPEAAVAGSAEPAAIVDVAVEGRPYRGRADAPVTVVEFTDYQCPFCARHFRETYRQLLSRYADTVRYVVRNFPIAALHPQAQKAAEAAECADEQGAFWRYHDLLFERAPALDVESLRAYAAEAGLDRGRFDACLASGRKASIVAKDLADGVAYGLTATPTFFINGRRVVGAATLAEFEAQISAALRQTRP
ncbi:MAG: DsbA family protein [Gemmatimonadetes bacterium]|nr:DsbA family protein [Gemmatimonadota bacterium]